MSDKRVAMIVRGISCVISWVGFGLVFGAGRLSVGRQDWGLMLVIVALIWVGSLVADFGAFLRYWDKKEKP